MNAKPIRIVLVDDHAVVRSGLSDFVMAFDDFELLGEAGGGREAVELCLNAKPDVVLMDMVMPDMDGATATRLIREANPDIQIIALTSFREEELVSAALKAGAIGYLLKNVSAEQLASAIRNAVHGCPTFAPEATLALMHAATAPLPLGHDLTERERDILPFLVQGLNNQQIAEALGVELSTIKYHVSNIISKLGASNRTEAASLVMQHHLVN
ncbi:MAG TPA: response regulator transcription factor [Phototrophicaceae bacterium]|nr:response regulator transcription factor [Phototrophicaceae bacterium]